MIVPLNHELAVWRGGIADASCTAVAGMASAVGARGCEVRIGDGGGGCIKDAIVVVVVGRDWG